MRTTDDDRATNVPNDDPAAVQRRRRTEKISETLSREILHAIMDRGLQSGDMLPAESEMLKTYRVGRGSLREALRILETQGLITIKPGPGGGPVVAGVHSDSFGRMATAYFFASQATFRELLEARLVMEPVMARQAAEQQDPTSIAKLKEVLEGSEGVASVDDRKYVRAASDFHDVVAGMSGNRILDLIARGIKDIYLDRIRGIHFPSADRQRIAGVHEEIANAIIAADTERAERLMREHMEEFAAVAEERFPGLMDSIVDWK